MKIYTILIVALMHNSSFALTGDFDCELNHGSIKGPRSQGSLSGGNIGNELRLGGPWQPQRLSLAKFIVSEDSERGLKATALLDEARVTITWDKTQYSVATKFYRNGTFSSGGGICPGVGDKNIFPIVP